MLYDDDGYEIDSEDDDEGAQEARATAAEFYPYSGVQIESKKKDSRSKKLSTLTQDAAGLLAPLTRPADLPDHPTLSRPFTSKPLTELTRQAREMMQKEKASLWRMKHLLTKLSGDHTWVPCEILETPEDINLFNDGRIGYREHLLEKDRLKDLVADNASLEEKTIATAQSALEGVPDRQIATEVVDSALPEVPAAEDDVAMITASSEAPVDETPEVVATAATETVIEAAQSSANEQVVSKNLDGDAVSKMDSNENAVDGDEKPTVPVQEASTAVESAVPKQETDSEDATKAADEMQLTVPDDEDQAEDQEEIPEPRRMRTRAQAQAASDNTTISRPRSATPSSNSSYIHPYFIAPLSAHPNADLGLPSIEAEETRRLQQLYIQKQEEICRGSQKLYDGLMKAERLRKTVLKWAKADGHIGEMSDGEDWYDKEEWGLSEDLKKGQDDDDEDAATAAKKTRTRRQ